MDDMNFYGDGYDFEREIAHGVSSFRQSARQAKKHEAMLGMLAIGRNVCFKKDGGDAPPPDPAIGRAAEMNAQISDKWLKFAEEQTAIGNKRQEVTDALSTKVINQQLAVQDQANQWAKEDRARTKTVFQPLQDDFINTAKNYDSADKQAEAASEATADVQKAADTQRQTSARQMASMGVNPASGRFAGITQANDLNTSIAAAGAANTARRTVRDKALALRADAINMGNGLASSTAAAYGIGTTAGNSAVGNNATANSSFFQNNNTMNTGFGGAMQGYANQGNILNNLYGNQLQAWNAQNQANATSSAGLGNMVGTIAGAGITAF